MYMKGSLWPLVSLSFSSLLQPEYRAPPLIFRVPRDYAVLIAMEKIVQRGWEQVRNQAAMLGSLSQTGPHKASRPTTCRADEILFSEANATVTQPDF